MLIGIPEIITCANFGDDRLRGLVGGVKVCYFAYTFVVVLTDTTVRGSVDRW